MIHLPPLVSRQYDNRHLTFPRKPRKPCPQLDSQFLSPQVLRYYYQSFIRFLIYFPSYVALANRVFILGRTSRLGSSQSWVNSGSYLTPKNIVQQLNPLIHKDCVSKLLSYRARSHEGLSSGVSPDVYTPHPFNKSRDFPLAELNLMVLNLGDRSY